MLLRLRQLRLRTTLLSALPALPSSGLGQLTGGQSSAPFLQPQQPFDPFSLLRFTLIAPLPPSSNQNGARSCCQEGRGPAGMSDARGSARSSSADSFR